MRSESADSGERLTNEMNVTDILGSPEEEYSNFVYVVAAIAALNGLLFGFDIGIISGALLYIKQSFALSTFLQEVVVSGVLVGAMLGAAVGGGLADRFGRVDLPSPVQRCFSPVPSEWGFRRT